MSETAVYRQEEYAGAEPCGELRALIRGSVVDDKDLVRSEALPERRRDAIFKDFLSIEVRDQYGNWRGHARQTEASGMVSRRPQGRKRRRQHAGQHHAGRYDGLVKQLIACATLIAAFSVAGSAQAADASSLEQVKTVYLLPMSHGLDQYLANRLTRAGVVQVSTDPLKADALLTDHLGANFEASVKELYPEPKPAAAAAKDDDEKKAGDDQKSAEPATETKPDPPEMKSTGFDHPPVPARDRGMVFLVKRGTGEVLWSTYHEPSIRRPKELNRTAGRIAEGLKKAMKPASAANARR